MARLSTYDGTPADVLAVAAAARAAGHPVFWSDEQDGSYVLVDHADVKAALQDWASYRSAPSVLRPIQERPRFQPIEYDPPAHTSLFAQVLNARAAELHADGVREDVVGLVERLAARGHCDLHRDFAEQVPLLALCRLLGFDPDKRDDRRRADEPPARGALTTGAEGAADRRARAHPRCSQRVDPWAARYEFVGSGLAMIRSLPATTG